MIRHIIFRYRLKKLLKQADEEYIESLERSNTIYKEMAYKYMNKHYKIKEVTK